MLENVLHTFCFNMINIIAEVLMEVLTLLTFFLLAYSSKTSKIKEVNGKVIMQLPKAYFYLGIATFVISFIFSCILFSKNESANSLVNMLKFFLFFCFISSFGLLFIFYYMRRIVFDENQIEYYNHFGRLKTSLKFKDLKSIKWNHRKTTFYLSDGQNKIAFHINLVGIQKFFETLKSKSTVDFTIPDTK